MVGSLWNVSFLLPSLYREKGPTMFVFVNNFEEAEKYPVLFGTSECFMDNNQDVFYLKSVDTMGKYTMCSYRFEQIENPRPLSSADFVSKKQFDDLSAKMDMLLNALQPAPPVIEAPPAQPAQSTTPEPVGKREKQHG